MKAEDVALAISDRGRLLADTREHIDAWNGVGKTLCDAFVDVAERVAAPA